MSESDAPDSTAAAADNADSGGRGPWLRFALTFGVLAIASEVLYNAVILDSDAFDAYLRVLARISGATLAFFGSDAVVHGTRISGSAFAVQVAQGCDAIQVCSLLTAAVIAFPVDGKAKLRGLAIGIFVLQVFNLLRIITLYLIGAHFASIFRTAHEVVWPGILIVLTLVIWIVWVRWEARWETPLEHAA